VLERLRRGEKQSTDTAATTEQPDATTLQETDAETAEATEIVS
jgi:hypothetical protein